MLQSQNAGNILKIERHLNVQKALNVKKSFKKLSEKFMIL